MQSHDVTTRVVQTAPWVRLAGDDTDAAIDTMELFSARRALALLKAKLGREPLLDLLQEEIAAGDAFLGDHLERSAGASATGTTVLHANGISAAEFVAWLSRAFAREDVMLAGHPEHFAIHAEPSRGVNIVETLGASVCSFFMRPWDGAVVADESSPTKAEALQNARYSLMSLGDGTAVGSIFTAFSEAPGGLMATLSVTLPVTCDPDVIQQHLDHFAVEFRTWIMRSIAEQPIHPDAPLLL